MCLAIITDRNPKKTGTGWKFLCRETDTKGKIVFFSEYQGNRAPMKDGRWLNERDFRCDKRYTKIDMNTVGDGTYPMGWHIYLKKPINFIVTKVRYRGAHTLGMQYMRQDKRDIVVSKEILIEKKGRK